MKQSNDLLATLSLFKLKNDELNERMIEEGKKSKCHFNNPSGLTTCPHGCGVPHFGAIVISIFMDFDPYKHPYCMYVLRPSSLLHILLSTAKVFKFRQLLLFWANIFVSFEHVLAKNR